MLPYSSITIYGILLKTHNQSEQILLVSGSFVAENNLYILLYIFRNGHAPALHSLGGLKCASCYYCVMWIPATFWYHLCSWLINKISNSSVVLQTTIIIFVYHEIFEPLRITGGNISTICQWLQTPSM